AKGACLGEPDNRGPLGPGSRRAWLVFAESRGLASYAQRAVWCSHHGDPLLVLPSNDGCCRFFCGESFLGNCAFASCAESTHEGGNAAYLFHLAGLLLLLSRPTGRCGQERAAMVRPECHRFWSGFGLA